MALSVLLLGLGPVATLILSFVVLSLLAKLLRERVELFLRSNVQFRFLDGLASYVHYGPDVGVDATLRLDSPPDDVFERRREGQRYLESKLGGGGGGGGAAGGKGGPDGRSDPGPALARSLVDCRFALAKVCTPLLRELEFPPRGFVAAVGHASHDASNDDSKEGEGDGAAGMLTATGADGVARPYVGNDAVQTLGVKSFYAPVQKEISRRMALDGADGEGGGDEAMLRFCPIAMNDALRRNVELVKRLTGADKVRYSLSGSEAVDAALKDCKASCGGKPLVVRFKSAYHGHLSGISFLDCADHVFLPEMSPSSLDFVERYHHRIAAVIVNPMQHFTGVNRPSPPGEKVNVGRRVRSAGPGRDDYARWLHDLQGKCRYCTRYLSRVAFVVDDIYFAFRTPELTSSRHFLHPDTGAELRPDVVVLGKGLAAGYPLSVVAGREGYLNSYDKKWLLKLNKTVGTFAAWHGGIVASNVFLEALNGDLTCHESGKPLLEVAPREQLSILTRKCDAFAASLNDRLERSDLPVRLRNFANVFSVDFLADSLYNSRYPQYLLAEGVFLGNYSTGKFNLSADVTGGDLDALEEKFVAAASKMRRHGYFEPVTPGAKRAFVLRLLVRFFANFAKICYDKIMTDKHIDIQVSHNHPVNKFGHFWSSVAMILFAYPLLFWRGEVLKGCAWFFASHVVRQAGHFFYEQQDRDIEKLKFGHKDASKKEAVAFLACAAAAYNYRAELWDFAAQYVDLTFFRLSLDQYALLIAFFTVVPHFVEIVHQYGFLRGISWAIKILTDPFTDLLDFYTHMFISPGWFLDTKDHRATYRLDTHTHKVAKVEPL